MPKFAANLSFLWTEVPFLDRFELAARAGFRGVEYHFPYSFDPVDIKARLDEFQLAPVLHNLWAGDSAAGEFGIACLPGRERDFQTSVAQAIHYASKLGTPRCNCLAGKIPRAANAIEMTEILVSNLRFAGKEFAKAGLVLTVEPLNSVDTPGFMLDTSAKAMAVLQQVALDNVLLQYDLYHMHLMEEDLAMVLKRLLPNIGHIQFADAPGRHEPGTGTINLTNLFSHIDNIGYAGWLGAEYRPSAATEASFGWFTPYRRDRDG